MERGFRRQAKHQEAQESLKKDSINKVPSSLGEFVNNQATKLVEFW